MEVMFAKNDQRATCQVLSRDLRHGTMLNGCHNGQSYLVSWGLTDEEAIQQCVVQVRP